MSLEKDNEDPSYRCPLTPMLGLLAEEGKCYLHVASILSTVSKRVALLAPSKCFAQRFCLLVVVERVQTKLTELGVSHKSGSAFPSFVCTGRLLGRKGSLRKERTEVVDWPSRAELSFACFCLSLVWDPLHNPLKLSSNIAISGIVLSHCKNCGIEINNARNIVLVQF